MRRSLFTVRVVGSIALVLSACATTEQAPPADAVAEAPPAVRVTPVSAPVSAPVIIGEVEGEPIPAPLVVDRLQRDIDNGVLDRDDHLAVRERAAAIASQVIVETAIRLQMEARMGEDDCAAFRAAIRESVVDRWGDGDPVEADRRLREQGHEGLDEVVSLSYRGALADRWARQFAAPDADQVDDEQVRRAYERNRGLWGDDFEAARPRIEARLRKRQDGVAWAAAVDDLLASAEYTSPREMGRRAAALVQ